MFITSVDAACAIDPNFCAEIFGQIAQNAAALSQNSCEQEAADAVAGAFNTVATIAAILPVVTNWKSVKQFGHTFGRHGAGVDNARNLAGRAAGTGVPQGQWLDNAQAAEYLNSLGLDGPASVRIPESLGQVILPNGTVVPAQWASVVPSSTGIRTAYPIIF